MTGVNPPSESYTIRIHGDQFERDMLFEVSPDQVAEVTKGLLALGLFPKFIECKTGQVNDLGTIVRKIEEQTGKTIEQIQAEHPEYGAPREKPNPFWNVIR